MNNKLIKRSEWNEKVHKTNNINLFNGNTNTNKTSVVLQEKKQREESRRNLAPFTFDGNKLVVHLLETTIAMKTSDSDSKFINKTFGPFTWSFDLPSPTPNSFAFFLVRISYSSIYRTLEEEQDPNAKSPRVTALASGGEFDPVTFAFIEYDIDTIFESNKSDGILFNAIEELVLGEISLSENNGEWELGFRHTAETRNPKEEEILYSKNDPGFFLEFSDFQHFQNHIDDPTTTPPTDFHIGNSKRDSITFIESQKNNVAKTSGYWNKIKSLLDGHSTPGDGNVSFHFLMEEISNEFFLKLVDGSTSGNEKQLVTIQFFEYKITRFQEFEISINKAKLLLSYRDLQDDMNFEIPINGTKSDFDIMFDKNGTVEWDRFGSFFDQITNYSNDNLVLLPNNSTEKLEWKNITEVLKDLNGGLGSNEKLLMINDSDLIEWKDVTSDVSHYVHDLELDANGHVTNVDRRGERFFFES